MANTAQKKKPIVSHRKLRKLLPESASNAVIANREFLLIPIDDFAEWFEDQILVAVANDRMERDGDKLVPFSEIVARLNGKRAKK